MVEISVELLNVDGVAVATGALTFHTVGDAEESSELFVKTLLTHPYEATVELPYATADRRMWYSVRLTID